MLKLESDGSITYRGVVVGKHHQEGGKDRVELALTYTASDDWIVPLTYFAIGLQKIEPLPPPSVIEIETPEDDIDEVFDVSALLIEKQIKRDGYIWRFHKTDPDTWPSPLHGHDYDKALTLDAITGTVFDKISGNKLKTLKRKALADVQAKLLACKDLKDVAAKYI